MLLFVRYGVFIVLSSIIYFNSTIKQKRLLKILIHLAAFFYNDPYT